MSFKSIIIEGPRNVGKTFLLEGIDHFKFDIIPFCKSFSPEGRDLGYFSIGKDLMALQLCQKYPTILDRGFLSSLVYGKIENRFSAREEERFIYNIQEILKDVAIVFIHGVNPFSRGPKDLFDKRFESYETQLSLYNYYIKEYFSEITIPFENDFTLNSKEKFNLLIQELNEH